MLSNEDHDYLDVPVPRIMHMKSSQQVLEPHSGSKTFKPRIGCADSNESGSLQMSKPKLIHNYSGPSRKGVNGSVLVTNNTMNDDASNISNSSGSEVFIKMTGD